jgi:hypothetical protein
MRGEVGGVVEGIEGGGLRGEWWGVGGWVVWGALFYELGYIDVMKGGYGVTGGEIEVTGADLWG